MITPIFETPSISTQSVVPGTLALYDLSGSGSTVYIELRDQNNLPIFLTDSNGAKWSAVPISVPTSTAIGLFYGILNNCTPDGTHTITALSTTYAYRVFVRCKSGTVSVNTGGTTTGLAGIGNGIALAGYAPSAFSPIQFLAGDWDQYGSMN